MNYLGFILPNVAIIAGFALVCMLTSQITRNRAFANFMCKTAFIFSILAIFIMAIFNFTTKMDQANIIYYVEGFAFLSILTYKIIFSRTEPTLKRKGLCLKPY